MASRLGSGLPSPKDRRPPWRATHSKQCISQTIQTGLSRRHATEYQSTKRVPLSGSPIALASASGNRAPWEVNRLNGIGSGAR
jgi:hypothetical protein